MKPASTEIVNYSFQGHHQAARNVFKVDTAEGVYAETRGYDELGRLQEIVTEQLGPVGNGVKYRESMGERTIDGLIKTRREPGVELTGVEKRYTHYTYTGDNWLATVEWGEGGDDEHNHSKYTYTRNDFGEPTTIKQDLYGESDCIASPLVSETRTLTYNEYGQQIGETGLESGIPSGTYTPHRIMWWSDRSFTYDGDVQTQFVEKYTNDRGCNHCDPSGTPTDWLASRQVFTWDYTHDAWGRRLESDFTVGTPAEWTEERDCDNNGGIGNVDLISTGAFTTNRTYSTTYDGFGRKVAEVKARDDSPTPDAMTRVYHAYQGGQLVASQAPGSNGPDYKNNYNNPETGRTEKFSLGLNLTSTTYQQSVGNNVHDAFGNVIASTGGQTNEAIFPPGGFRRFAGEGILTSTDLMLGGVMSYLAFGAVFDSGQDSGQKADGGSSVPTTNANPIIEISSEVLGDEHGTIENVCDGKTHPGFGIPEERTSILSAIGGGHCVGAVYGHIKRTEDSPLTRGSNVVWWLRVSAYTEAGFPGEFWIGQDIDGNLASKQKERLSLSMGFSREVSIRNVSWAKQHPFCNFV